MKKIISIIIGIIVLILIIWLVVVATGNNANDNANVTTNTNSDAMMDDTNTNEVIEEMNTNEAMENDAMMEDTNTNSVSQNTAGEYTDYTEAAFAAASGTKRVYFFHAKWCPTCQAANTAFNENLSEIPDNVVLFKTDYDTETTLKQRYGITYQHTFVQVDENGNELAKWNGGDIDELQENII